jgi:hypothetical protein
MKVDVEAKKSQLAESIAGEVIENQAGLAICIKGEVDGYPIRLQAIYPGWPFGVQYIIETNLQASVPPSNTDGGSRITVYPRVGRGIASFLTFLFLFESKSMPVGDKRLEDQFNFVYENAEVAHNLMEINGIADQLRNLEAQSHFSELIIRTDVGIYLAQPSSFDSLDPDVCYETMGLMAGLASLLKESI